MNVARGHVVDEPALIEALRHGAIGGAALDCVAEEPLPANSPLWDMPGVLITSHTAGETQAYEDNVIDILLENLDRMRRGEENLRNGIVRRRLEVGCSPQSAMAHPGRRSCTSKP